MNGPGQASCSTSTSRSSAGSSHLATASPAIAGAGRRSARSGSARPAGSSCTSASTTRPGWPTPRFCPTSAARPPPASCAALSPGSTAWASNLSACSQTIGACYRSRVHAAACRELGLKAKFTRPYRPRTNGKAERFIKTLTYRWAYGAIYGTSAERTRALPGWLTHYNFTRRHGALSHQPPAARLNELNNLTGNYT